MRKIWKRWLTAAACLIAAAILTVAAAAAELPQVGIDTAEKFGKVIHAAQSLTSSRQIKALEAKRDAERKAKRTAKPCSQFINHGHAK